MRNPLIAFIVLVIAMIAVISYKGVELTPECANNAHVIKMGQSIEV